MKYYDNVPVKKEWGLAILDVFRFFLQHTNIEIDGANQTARVNYNGPNGWKFSIDTAHQPMIDVSASDKEVE